ncbi:succinate semialdehyde dehydrogenase NADP+ linked [Fusarium falciforme]|nr:succinate semialdehyde dehydrogenase NADP+ linked [Fusarium falciforme]
MELGGNSPFIVFDDCPDPDDAVAGALAAKFRGSGQTCVAANRIFVQEGIHDAFVREFSKAVAKFKVGNGFGQGVTHGPAISIRAVEKMEIHVQDAVAKGAEVIVGGTRPPHLGPTFFTPTVLKGMKPDMQMFREETFGPVAGIYSFSTEEEVVELANDTQVGLAGYVFSRDVDRIHRVTEALDVGMVGVNTGVISDAAVPFGGVRESGFGREGSKYGVGDYMVLKTVVSKIDSQSYYGA